MNLQKTVVAVTTIADGSQTAYSPVLTGEIVNVVYTKSSFADGVDFVITNEGTAQGIWSEDNVNASKTVCPGQPIHTQAGVAALYAAAGQGVLAPLVLVNERVKIVIAAGGDTKAGTFTIITK